MAEPNKKIIIKLFEFINKLFNFIIKACRKEAYMTKSSHKYLEFYISFQVFIALLKFLKKLKNNLNFSTNTSIYIIKTN